MTATGTSENLFGVWGSSSSNVFVVGGNGAVIRYDGSSWSPMSGIPDYVGLYGGIWGSSGVMFILQDIPATSSTTTARPGPQWATWAHQTISMESGELPQ